MAWVDPATLGLNLLLIIVGVVLAVVAIIAIVAGWTGINLAIWLRRRREAGDEYRRARYRPDGQPRPPTGRGVCSRCSRAQDTVYHLPSGERLCPSCYERAGRPAAPPDQP